MIQHVWTILANSCSIDKQSNQISIFEAVEEFQVLPVDMNVDRIAVAQGHVRVGLPSFALLTLWTRSVPTEPCRGMAQVRLIDPAGAETILDAGTDVDLTENARHRQIIRMVGLPLTVTGRYRFEIRFKNDPTEETWALASVLPLDVQMPANTANN